MLHNFFQLFLTDPENDPSWGQWSITDCNPGHDHSCAGVHQYVRNTVWSVKGEACPWDVNGPWEYCTGDLTVQGGCTQYTVDSTIEFNCNN